MRAAFLLLALTVFLSPATVEYSGLVDLYSRCGAYVTEFGRCSGECFGFIMAIGATAARPPVRVYIGDTEAVVNYTVYRVDDRYQPNLWVVEFRGRGVGLVRVESSLSVEAYVLVNFGVGESKYVKVLTLPYFAGRGETRPWELQLGAEGEMVVCTVGKYAARGEVYSGGVWRPASVSTGWYHAVVRGEGSAVRLYWSNTPESAIKVAYVIFTKPRGPDRAFVVGQDGSPVPAQFLRLMAGPGVVVEGDGVVSFFGSGYLRYGGRQVELRPNSTAVVEGRRCLYVGQTTTGEPLEVAVLLDGKPAASGRGQAEAFCIPGATKARYTYQRQYPIANITHTIEADTNYTLPIAKIELVVHDVFRLPRERYKLEAPQGYPLRIYLKRYNYTESFEATPGTKGVYPYKLINQWEFLLLIPMAHGVVMALRRRPNELLQMALLTAVLVMIYYLVGQLLGWRPSTFLAYLALVLLVVPAVAVFLSGDFMAFVIYTGVLAALVYTIAVNLGNPEGATLALSAAAVAALKGSMFLAVTPLAVKLNKCICKSNLADARKEAYKKVENQLKTGRRVADIYLRELARHCRIRTFARSTEALALCMANGGAISWRLYVALKSGTTEEIVEAIRAEVV